MLITAMLHPKDRSFSRSWQRVQVLYLLGTHQKRTNNLVFVRSHAYQSLCLKERRCVTSYSTDACYFWLQTQNCNTWWYVVVRGGTWWYVVVRGGGAKTMDSFTSCFAQIVPFFVFPSLCSLRLQAGRTQHVLGTQRVQHFELKKKRKHKELFV